MKNVLFFIIISFLFSCKKDKLKDEKSILEGSWTWTSTYHNYGWCDNESWEETLTPISEGENFSIQFFKNGIVKLYKGDNELIQKTESCLLILSLI